jgi:putative hydrolase of the HAD superfamily
MKAVLFDLDDTLYPEMSFVRSGFKAVAGYLGSRFGYEREAVSGRLLNILNEQGRGRIFDRLLSDLGIYDEDRVRLLVYIYRSHKPEIKLFPEALPMLRALKRKGLLLGLITDGMASVQRNKIAALQLESELDLVLCSDELGREYWKPSPVPFKLALEWLRVAPGEAVYVGDNLAKDFQGANTIGMGTIMLRHDRTARIVSVAEPLRARFCIDNLAALPDVVARLLSGH